MADSWTGRLSLYFNSFAGGGELECLYHYFPKADKYGQEGECTQHQ